MSHQEKGKLSLRLCQSLAFSSTSVMSPVTDLAVNLGELSTNSGASTPKRRLDEIGDTPDRVILGSFLTKSAFVDSPTPVDSPMLQERVLRDVNGGRQRHLRRIRSHPLQRLPFAKENIPSHESRSENLPISSPSKSGLCKFLAVGDAASDTDSQDSGYCDSQGVKIEWSPSRSTISQSSSVYYTRESVNTDEDDGLMNLLEIDKFNEETLLPSSMTGLLTAPLGCDVLQKDASCQPLTCQNNDNERKLKPAIRRCLSMTTEGKSEMSNHSTSGSMNSTECTSSLSISETTEPAVEEDYNTVSSNNIDPDTNNNNRYKENTAPYDSCLPTSNQGFFLKDLKSAFKRPEPPKHVSSPIQNKRRKSIVFHTRPRSESEVLQSKKTTLQRSHSETEASIMKALQRSVQEPDLIGDFSKPYILPLIHGKNEDLRSITPETVVSLLNGEYNHAIDSYIIIDCRYPYEYNGGHIQSANNIYTREGIMEKFLSEKNKPGKNSTGRNIVIFHCEFSSERAPMLYRFLRNMDRQMNKEKYPDLHHPEVYVLDGGYKAFYEKYMEYCEPKDYKPMLHKDHEQDLRHFRAKSKSWSGDSKAKVAVRPGLKF
ncbi:M-phase inducer phosphatase-like [Limulus polyphemus]|uniref:M-phase inducer phosphatase n=1 Tax=Limulus polyphemus TaxID=6850 RepID=A0ABM1BKJ8_LIMPO|nr:M-phase inducer phosphatase-like [Limulus polyphemus]